MSRSTALMSAAALSVMSACIAFDAGDDDDPSLTTESARVPAEAAFCDSPGTMRIPIAAIPGSNGTLCDWTSSSTRKCVSTDRRRPITAGQTVDCDDDLYLCTDSGGALSGCEPGIPSGPDPWCQDDACVCITILDCAEMITAKACGSGCPLTCEHGEAPDTLVCSCPSGPCI